MASYYSAKDPYFMADQIIDNISDYILSYSSSY